VIGLTCSNLEVTKKVAYEACLIIMNGPVGGYLK